MLLDEERKRKLSIDAMSALRSALDGSVLGTTANGDDRSGSALEAALDGALAAYEDEPLSPLDQPFPPAETAEQARAQLLARRGLGGGRRQRSYSDQLPRQRQHPAIARAGGGIPAMMGGIGVSGIPALSVHLPPRRAGGGGDDGGGGGLRGSLGAAVSGRSRSGSAASSGGGRSRSGSIGGSTAVQDAAVASAYRRKTSLDAAAAMAQGGALQAAFLGAPRGSPAFGAAPPPPPSSPAMPPMQGGGGRGGGGGGGGGASAAPRRSPGSSPLSGSPLSDGMQSPLRLGSPAHNNAAHNRNAHYAAFSRGAVLPVPSYRGPPGGPGGPAAAQGQPRPASPSTSPRGSLQRAAALRHHQMTHHLGAPYVSASAPSAVGMWEQLQQKQRGVPPPAPQQQQQQWGAGGGAGGGAAAAEESSSGGSSGGDSSSDDGEFFGAFGRSAKDRRPSQEWAQLGDDSAGTASEMARLQKQAHLLEKVGAAGGGGEWGTVLSPKQIREKNAKLRPRPARPITIAAPLAAAAEVAKRGFVWSDSDSDGSMDDFYYASKGQGAGARRSGGKSNSVKQTVQRGVQTAKRAAQRASSKR